MKNQRIKYLESIRGLAAIQVLLVHFIEALLPAVWSASPSTSSFSGGINFFRYAWEGHGAVYIFFALSGYVLTLAFEKNTPSIPAVIASRIARLAIPALASVIFAYLLYRIVGVYNLPAAAIVESKFLLQFSPEITVAEVFRDGVLNSTLFGYLGECQDSCRLPHAIFRLFSPLAAACTIQSRSGFNATVLIGDQSRV